MVGQFNIRDAFPGLALCAIVALAGYGVEMAETALFGHAWFESLVLAILIGAFLRTVFGLHARYEVGVKIAAKFFLEVAIVLLGASISLSTIGSVGLPLLLGVAASVIVAIAASYAIGRLLRLEHRLAILVACGNSICGNSAIVSVAPVVDARAEDVTASIAFTAALGILVVLILPFGQHLSGMSEQRYGIISGMTVYAVPQVLAATAPVGLVSMQLGTLVKLVRVMMLAPVMFLVGFLNRRQIDATQPGNVRLGRLVPWFIVGFVLLMGMRSANLLPAAVLAPASNVATALTIISMAALGLSADMRTIVRSGSRVLLTGALSLVVLIAISLLLLTLLGIR